MNDFIQAPALEIRQPIGSFYICKLSAEEIIYISKADVRRLGNKDRDVETYIGIQRELSFARVKELKKYVNLVDAAFPNTIILAISSEKASFDSTTNVLSITAQENVGKVLDGQHRIAGLEGYTRDEVPFEVIVAIFIDMDIEDQAIMFATINKTQTKVNQSLVADLYEFAHTRSPQKTCHNIARALDQLSESPFFEKIKILGSANDPEKETITQATFVNSLIRYISKDPMKDRDDIKRGKKLDKLNLNEFIFRQWFLEEDDKSIAKMVMNYFSAVQQCWPVAWDNNTRDFILNRSTGFISLMKFLFDCCKALGFSQDVIKTDEFSSILKKIKLVDADFTKNRFIPGSSGQAALYKEFQKALEE